MSILNEHLTTRPKPIERLRPHLKDTGFWQDLLDQMRSSNVKSNQKQWDTEKNGPWPPSLQSVVKRSSSYPSYAAIIGICGDGLPFLLDLSNPAPGSILITGDTGSGKIRLMRSILKSVTKLNPSKHVEYNLITPQPESFTDILNVEHCRKIADHTEKSTVDIIEKLAEITDKRRRSRPQDPAIILVIDDLAGLTQTLDHQVFATLYWLIKHGPRSRIWPIVSINAEENPIVDPRLLGAFRTRLVGNIQNRKLSASITDDRRSTAHKLEQGMQFIVPYGDEWIPFWICDPD